MDLLFNGAKVLVITEKGDLLRDVTSYIYPGVNKGQYWEYKNVSIIATDGHILESLEPDEYDPELGSPWQLSKIPFRLLPFKKKPVAKKINRWNALNQLIKHTDIVIHCGDPDDEGQLIVDEIIEYTNFKDKVYRVFLSDNTEAGVKKSFEKMSDNKLHVNRGISANCRQIGDKHYGLIFTRLYTLLVQKSGIQVKKISVGRVLTPTQALVVNRDRLIENHTKVYYYTITGKFNINNINFEGQYRVNPDKDDLNDKKQITDKNVADLIVKETTGKQAYITKADKKHEIKKHPFPFNKATATAAIAKRFKLPLKKIDTILDELRLTHKLITYSRSDCVYLNDEIHATCPDRMETVLKLLPQFNDFKSKLNLKQKSRAFDNSKVEVHHGIIPTANNDKKNLSALSKDELNIYTLICEIFVSQFLPAHELDRFTVEINCQERFFTSSEIKVTNPGWKLVYKNDDDDDEESSIGVSNLSNNDKGLCEKSTRKDKETKPPARYTAATLMSDMNCIAKYVKDEKIKKLLLAKDADNPLLKGSIGTPATQSSIISGLIDDGYFKEDKGYLISQPLCRSIIDLLPEYSTQPDLTALWFEKQDLISKGQLSAEEFVNEILDNIETEVNRVKSTGLNLSNIDVPKCTCGGILRRAQNKTSKEFFWFCSNYETGCKLTYQDKKGNPIMEKEASIQCPECSDGQLLKRKGKDGKPDWWGCSKWQDGCTARFQDIKGKPKFEKDPEYDCPDCKEGKLRQRTGSNGAFWGCSNYQNGCKSTFQDVKGKPKLEKDPEYDCPDCKEGKLRKRTGTKGDFWGCSNYQNGCKSTFQDAKGKPVLEKAPEYDCPDCKEGKLRQRTGSNGPFWGCSNYQNGCKSTFQDAKGKPILEKAPQYDCPKCETGKLVKRIGKDGKPDWWGCTKWQDGCKARFEDMKGKPVIED
jgi:DNA topoisomerase-3